MTKINRTTQQDRDRKSIAAIQKYLMQLATMLVAGVAYTPAQFIALLQKDIDLADAASNAREYFRVAAGAARQQRATMTPILVGFRAFLENMFTDPSTIAEFGFLSRTRSKPTAETTAVAVSKAGCHASRAAHDGVEAEAGHQGNGRPDRARDAGSGLAAHHARAAGPGRGLPGRRRARPCAGRRSRSRQSTAVEAAETVGLPGLSRESGGARRSRIGLRRNALRTLDPTEAAGADGRNGDGRVEHVAGHRRPSSRSATAEEVPSPASSASSSSRRFDASFAVNVRRGRLPRATLTETMAAAGLPCRRMRT